jgi:hypothetical protein
LTKRVKSEALAQTATPRPVNIQPVG